MRIETERLIITEFTMDMAEYRYAVVRPFCQKNTKPIDFFALTCYTTH